MKCSPQLKSLGINVQHLNSVISNVEQYDETQLDQLTKIFTLLQQMTKHPKPEIVQLFSIAPKGSQNHEKLAVSLTELLVAAVENDSQISEVRVNWELTESDLSNIALELNKRKLDYSVEQSVLRMVWGLEENTERFLDLNFP
ncbi:hypothetical protein HK098_004911 [Nowakowskiella sp. JEL0407]|nr:hypothetical protein HK098_004911 [Nowakowskiella sp. JEL0407]